MNAWVVDFGGGFSPTWIDENLEGTIAGDNEAMKKIKEYLCSAGPLGPLQ